MLQRQILRLACVAGVLFAAASPAGEAMLPENFPAAVPIYPGARVIGASSENESGVVILETSATWEDVEAFYRKALVARAGWALDARTAAIMGPRSFAVQAAGAKVAFNMQPASGELRTLKIYYSTH